MTDASPHLSPFSFAVFFSSDSPSLSPPAPPPPPPPPLGSGGILHGPGRTRAIIGLGGNVETACLSKFKFLLPAHLEALYSTVCMCCGWERTGVMFLYGNIKFVLLIMFSLLSFNTFLCFSLSLSVTLFKLYFHSGCRLI